MAMNTMQLDVPRPLMLGAVTAADLMTANPVSIRERATVRDAVKLLIDRRVSAAPVIDEAGRPVGVLSQTDILVHDRERVEHVAPAPEFFHRADLTTPEGEELPGPPGGRTRAPARRAPHVRGHARGCRSAKAPRRAGRPHQSPARRSRGGRSRA